MHYVDVGPADAPVVLMLHGEPSWSFSWRKVIAPVVAAGYRALAPDHIGFGRSDKLAERSDYSYQQYIDWMIALIQALDLQRIVLLAQDWGGPIGLSALAAMPERFNAVIVANTLLPNCQAPPQGVADWPGELIANWVAMSAAADDLPISDIVAGVVLRPLPADVKRAYDAPFPDVSYKAAALQFPSLIPINPSMPGVEQNRRVWKVLEQWQRPLVTAFSDGDPTTRDWQQVFQQRVPGAAGMPHTVIAGAGHFLQEEQGEALGQFTCSVIASHVL
jgi:haloalkane dehalogenase